VIFPKNNGNTEITKTYERFDKLKAKTFNNLQPNQLKYNLNKCLAK